MFRLISLNSISVPFDHVFYLEHSRGNSDEITIIGMDIVSHGVLAREWKAVYELKRQELLGCGCVTCMEELHGTNRS